MAAGVENGLYMSIVSLKNRGCGLTPLKVRRAAYIFAEI
jgi:hypothetical protein